MFSSFSNNTAKKYCIYLYKYYCPSCKHQIKKSNIISNSGKNLINGDGETDIIECCVESNQDFPVFSGTIIIYNCSIPKDQFEESTVNTESIGTNTFINSLNLHKLETCYEYIPKRHTKFYHELFHHLLINNIYLFSIVLSS